MDLRAIALQGASTAFTAAGPEPAPPDWQPTGQAWEPLLMAGCVLAQEMRAALKVLPDTTLLLASWLCFWMLW